jgi:GntR family transcriptional regulator
MRDALAAGLDQEDVRTLFAVVLADAAKKGVA